jgi:hypothetical protein
MVLASQLKTPDIENRKEIPSIHWTGVRIYPRMSECSDEENNPRLSQELNLVV